MHSNMRSTLKYFEYGAREKMIPLFNETNGAMADNLKPAAASSKFTLIMFRISCSLNIMHK